MSLSRLFFQTALLVVLAVPHAQAQIGGDGDQPGYVPNADEEQLDPRWEKTVVFYRTTEAPGTIIVNTNERFLYIVQGNGRALRYGIGVGRDGFQWQGLVRITKKQEWPDWTPPPEMIQRQPYLPRWMAGGPGNPLGARALYLGKTLYRIHGTNQPSTIGKNVSSGCVRLLNEDIEDLFSRVQVGTRVVVLPGEPAPATVQNAPPASAPMQIGPVTEDMRADAASSGGAISSSPLPPPPTTRR